MAFASVDQLLAECPNGRLGSVAGIDFSQNVLHVFLDGFDTYSKRESDFTVIQPERDMPQDLGLAVRQGNIVTLILANGHDGPDLIQQATLAVVEVGVAKRKHQVTSVKRFVKPSLGQMRRSTTLLA